MDLKHVFLPAVVLILAACAAAGEADKPAAPAAPADEGGFVSLFNGKDLTDWDGDPRLWSVVDGAIRGQTTLTTMAMGNTFCIWKGGQLKDFVLKIKFRIQNGNSGVQYRSQDRGKWRVSGYQAEVENNPGKVGFLYHEGGRGWLVNVGDFMIIDKEGKKNVLSKVADVKALVAAGYYKDKDWNEYTIAARGNHITHVLNGYQTMELIDDDPKGRAMEGILALQIHAGPPMTVEFKDIRLRQLKADFGQAVRLFNGADLTGWTTSSDAVKDTFGVSDGVLTNTGRPAGYLRTTEDYTSYFLSMQVRHVTKGNGGVLLRMHGEDKVWPNSIEAQGMAGTMGDIFNIGQFPMKTPPERTSGRRTKTIHPSNERPVGEWNHYAISLHGGDLRIYVNGLLQNTAADCKEIPGKICLQSEGAKMEYRNVVLVPIK